MALKPRYKRRIFWSIIITFGIFIMALVFIPPMINLNYLGPKITQTIAEQTGIETKINGDIHFSLLGRATIVAHDVTIPHGTIDSLMFSIPLTHIFNLDDAPLTGDITVYRANITIYNLMPQNFNYGITHLYLTQHRYCYDYRIKSPVITNSYLCFNIDSQYF